MNPNPVYSTAQDNGTTGVNVQNPLNGSERRRCDANATLSDSSTIDMHQNPLYGEVRPCVVAGFPGAHESNNSTFSMNLNPVYRR